MREEMEEGRKEEEEWSDGVKQTWSKGREREGRESE